MKNVAAGKHPIFFSVGCDKEKWSIVLQPLVKDIKKQLFISLIQIIQSSFSHQVVLNYSNILNLA